MFGRPEEFCTANAEGYSNSGSPVPVATAKQADKFCSLGLSSVFLEGGEELPAEVLRDPAVPSLP